MAIPAYAKPPYAPTRFPKGITNANQGETLGNLAVPDPTKLHALFSDLDLGITGWTAVTTAAVAGDGGLATITAAGSLTTPVASFMLKANRRAFVKTKIAAVGLTASIITGFYNTVLVPTNGMYVTVANNLLTLTVGALASTPVTVAYTAGAQFTVGIELTPQGKVKAYFNDALVASVTPVLTGHLDVALSAGVSSATANATLDYLYFATER